MDFGTFVKRHRIPIGIFLIIMNFAIGFVSKLPFFELVYNPSAFQDHPTLFISAAIAYIFSWVIGFFGAFLIGKEAYIAIKQRMKKQVHETYHHHVGKHVDRHVKPHVARAVRKIQEAQEEYARKARKSAELRKLRRKNRKNLPEEDIKSKIDKQL